MWQIVSLSLELFTSDDIKSCYYQVKSLNMNKKQQKMRYARREGGDFAFSGLFTGDIWFPKICCCLSSLDSSNSCTVTISYKLLAASITPLMIFLS
ncbi:hypothetical protein HanRHA438_Chr01g0033371 [Helianthus annuus]|nr:hypothetical protein HanRHA438_Chr01g0033371 [Helianthus annuus]